MKGNLVAALLVMVFLLVMVIGVRDIPEKGELVLWSISLLLVTPVTLKAWGEATFSANGYKREKNMLFVLVFSITFQIGLRLTQYFWPIRGDAFMLFPLAVAVTLFTLYFFDRLH